MENNKIKLEEEKKLLEEELRALGKFDVETGDWEAVPENEISSQEVPDEGDMAERTEDYEERSVKLNALESRYNDIKKALNKIIKGGYGICEICQKKIEEERLEANPSASTCEACMEKVI